MVLLAVTLAHDEDWPRPREAMGDAVLLVVLAVLATAVKVASDHP